MSGSKIFIATLLLSTSLYTNQSYAQSNEGSQPNSLQMLFQKATGQSSDETDKMSQPTEPVQEENTENKTEQTLEEKLSNPVDTTAESTELPKRNTLPNPSETTENVSTQEEEISNLPVLPQTEKNNLDAMAPGNKQEEVITDIPSEKADLPKVVAPPLNNLKEINNLNSEIAILELQLKKAQLKKDIKTAQKEEEEITGQESVSVAPQPQQPQQQNQIPEGAYPPGMLPQFNNMQNMQMNNQQNQMPEKSAFDYEREALPIVNLVSGTNDQLTARLLLLGGHSKIVKEGTKVPGGFVVKSITTDNVILKGQASGKDHILYFGNHYPQQKSQNSSNMNNNSPVGGFNQGFQQGIPY